MQPREPSSSAPAPERSAWALGRAQASLAPGQGVQQAIKARMQRRIATGALLQQAAAHIVPDASLAPKLWQRIAAHMEPMVSGSLWSLLRGAMKPSHEMMAALRLRILAHLEPAPSRWNVQRGLKFAAALTLVLFAVRMSPFLFIASPSIAESPVLLLPTSGEVSVLIGGLWQPVSEELTLQKGALIQVGHEGSATLIMHDDGVLRIASGTTVAVHDLSDRPAHSSQMLTFTLLGGKIWAQALIPEVVGRGWVIATSQGNVLVNQGSVSIEDAKDGIVDVQVWNRVAKVRSGVQDLSLLAGERMQLSHTSPALVKKIPDGPDSSWVNDNLERDAVHRKEVSLFQQQRRIRSAGILPTSTLYPVKRVAEAVDMLLTFGKEAKAQKLLDQADTRLNEATALLVQGSGSTAAQEPLKEYRQTLLAVATGSGQDALLQQMVRDQVTAEVADVSATLPDDQGYLVKKTVLETSAALPQSGVSPEDVQGAVLVDQLTALTKRVHDGDLSGAQKEFVALEPMLTLTDERKSPLSSEVRKEAQSALRTFAQALEEQSREQGSGTILLGQFLTPKKAAPVQRTLTDAEIDALVEGIRSRIFLYSLPRSRYNQLLAEFRALDGNQDQGRILRRLHLALPEEGLARYVRTEFQRVRESHEQAN